MSRPLRIEYPGAVYHITSRGNSRKNIYKTKKDMGQFLIILGNTIQRYNWCCYAYCLMSNHYHILVETPYGNLSRGMRHLNGVYTQKYNSINKHIGHVFQGRYKALLVEKESYLSEVARYILLNPVKAKIVRKASEWIWSSYKYTVGIKETPGWLNTDELLGRFGVDKKMAINNFKEFIAEDVKDNLLDQVKGQIYLGRDKFIKKLSGKEIRKEIPIKQQRLRQKPLQVILRKGGNIEEVYSAYAENGYKMREIAEYLKVHYATVSRRIKKYEK